MPKTSHSDEKKLSASRMEQVYDEIRTVYRSDGRPWVIGYSGGKDSTTVLQLIWTALAGLPRRELTKTVHVISSDTLVESPVVANYIRSAQNRINEAAAASQMPFEAKIVYPRLEETFWVNLIGRGYPAPYKRFRWCTDRLKIQPANRFIMDKVAAYGEVVLVLGVRRAESAARAQVMALHRRVGDKLSRHSTLRNAWVYTPIEDWSLDDVWTYLLSIPSPWGANNRDLVTMYRNAQAGECPLVVDTTTPSCGNSRFGCWTCTVVEHDKSMESMIDNGEEWLEPLLDLRDWLAETQDPDTKVNIRSVRRRDGRVHTWGEKGDKLIWGPYQLVFRKEILKRVLKAQKAVRENGPDHGVELIREDELHEIRRLWRVEEGDWEDSVPTLYREVTGEDLPWTAEDVGPPSLVEATLLHDVAEQHELPVRLLRELIDLERRFHGMSRRSGIYNQLGTVLAKDWRSDEEVLASLSQPEEKVDGVEEEVGVLCD